MNSEHNGLLFLEAQYHESGPGAVDEVAASIANNRPSDSGRTLGNGVGSFQSREF